MTEKMNKTFMSAVEEHERSWGQETYPKRPSLIEILSAPVVVFWQSTEKMEPPTITLHETLNDIEKHFVRLLIARNAELPAKRIVWVFQDQQRLIIKGMNIVFGKAIEK